ncbi:MAG TPA: phosphatase PAP2 family protein [Patescibacteria group bacterium]
MSSLLVVDESIVRFLNGLLVSNTALGAMVFTISLYAVYVIPFVWLGWWFLASKKTRYDLFSSMFAGLVAWEVINRIAKLFFERQRPIHELPLKEILFERPENSFPSDHAAFMSAIAFFFLLRGQKKAASWLFVLALAAGIARVAVAVHYPSDILVGFLDGFLAAWVVSYFHEVLSKLIWTPLLRLAQKLHLA